MSYKILIIDTETGGLDPLKHSILSIGAVVLEDGVIKDEFYSLLKENSWSLNTTEEALKVNGLSVEEIMEKGTDIRDAMVSFKEFLEKNQLTSDKIILGGHNVNFDIGFLKRWFRLISSEREFNALFSYRSIDTMSIAFFFKMAGRLSNLKSASLDDVCKVFRLSRTSKDHNSLEDAKLTAQVLSELITLVQPKVDF